MQIFTGTHETGDPYNATTGEAYRGGNVLRLLTAECENDYSPLAGWAGFKQWRTVGRTVRKGEHGTACLTVVNVDDNGKDVRKPRGFKVFHFDQTEPWTPEAEAAA